MPKQIRSEEKRKRWSFCSRCANQVAPDDAWISNQKMDTGDDSTACATGYAEEVVDKSSQSKIFDEVAINWILQSGEMDSASQPGKPKVTKVDWKALGIKRQKDRELELWQINHMEAKKRKGVADHEMKEIQRPWRLPRKLEELDFSRYSLRIRRMMEKLKEWRKLEKVPPAEDQEQLLAEKKVRKKKE